MPDDVGPPSLTNAILRLADGRLVLSVESNKPYLDTSPWFQRVVHLRSGRRGPDLVDAGRRSSQDPTGGSPTGTSAARSPRTAGS